MEFQMQPTSPGQICQICGYPFDHGDQGILLEDSQLACCQACAEKERTPRAAPTAGERGRARENRS